jgi:hypothetical protein
MAKRKKKRQTERVLEPLVKPGQPLKVPDKAPAITPSRVVLQGVPSGVGGVSIGGGKR